MAAPSSKSTICKLALDLLQESNQEPVVDIDDPDTDIESICSRWYDHSRRACLRRKPWTFAKKRAAIVASGTTPAFGYSQQYNLPNDFIRLLTIESPTIFSTRYEMNYEIEGSTILMDGDTGSSVNIVYIYDLTNVTLMDPFFIDYLVRTLALNLGYKFTVSNATIERLKILRDEAMMEASSIVAQESPIKRREHSRALNARRRLSGSTGSKYVDPGWFS